MNRTSKTTMRVDGDDDDILDGNDDDDDDDGRASDPCPQHSSHQFLLPCRH